MGCSPVISIFRESEALLQILTMDWHLQIVLWKSFVLRNLQYLAPEEAGELLQSVVLSVEAAAENTPDEDIPDIPALKMLHAEIRSGTAGNHIVHIEASQNAQPSEYSVMFTPE